MAPSIFVARVLMTGGRTFCDSAQPYSAAARFGQTLALGANGTSVINRYFVYEEILREWPKPLDRDNKRPLRLMRCGRSMVAPDSRLIESVMPQPWNVVR